MSDTAPDAYLYQTGGAYCLNLTSTATTSGGVPTYAGALAPRQVIDPRDVAVGPEAAQLALEAIPEIEGGLRRLRRVLLVGVYGVHLEDGGHCLVREAAYVPELARPRDSEPAVEVRLTGTHVWRERRGAGASRPLRGGRT